MSTTQGHALEITRQVGAPVGSVYAAWTDTAQMRQWMAPEGIEVGKLEADLAPGGDFLIEMITPDGPATAVGTYREIVPDQRLVYTWRWKEQPDMADSLVTVEFAASGEGTEIRLTHTGFTDEKAVTDHNMGWTSCLDGLEKLFG